MKLNSLLKKAELFEKLALYGNRADFLKALAQEITFPDSDISNKIFSAVSSISSVIQKFPNAKRVEDLKSFVSTLEKYSVSNIGNNANSVSKTVLRVLGNINAILINIGSTLIGEFRSEEQENILQNAKNNVQSAFNSISQFRISQGWDQKTVNLNTKSPGTIDMPETNISARPFVDNKLSKYNSILNQGENLVKQLKNINPNTITAEKYQLKSQVEMVQNQISEFFDKFPEEYQTGEEQILGKKFSKLLQDLELNSKIYLS